MYIAVVLVCCAAPHAVASVAARLGKLSLLTAKDFTAAAQAGRELCHCAGQLHLCPFPT